MEQFMIATKHPNVVDPDVFYDKNGNLWMVYGSYSGIYILRMDESTGKPYAGRGYSKKLLGMNHSRIEAPYMLYSPETDYYYMFLSFGGLDANGGYNIRVCRSKNPDGPFLDASGKDMINCRGAAGTLLTMYPLHLMEQNLWGTSNLQEAEQVMYLRTQLSILRSTNQKILYHFPYTFPWTRRNT